NNMHQAFAVLQKLEDKKMQSMRAGIAELLTPAAMLLLSCASIMNTGINTLPTLVKMRAAEGKEPSMAAEMIMHVTNTVADNWHILMAIVIIAAISIYSTVKTTQGRFWLDHYTLRIPLLGNYIAYKVYTSMLLYF